MSEPASKQSGNKKTANIAVGFCLDETGSMDRSRESTISGFNEYLADVKGQKGKTRLSLTKFSDVGASEPTFRPVCEAEDIKSVSPLSVESYQPRGNTPLFDAIGYTIKKLESWLSAQKGKWSVLFVIQTDGEENASREYTREAIFDLIRTKEAEGWRFIYLGVDQDEYAAQRASTSFGMAPGSSYGYARHEQAAVTHSVAATMACFRSEPTMSSADLSAYTKTQAQKRRTPPPPIQKKGSSKPNF